MEYLKLLIVVAVGCNGIFSPEAVWPFEHLQCSTGANRPVDCTAVMFGGFLPDGGRGVVTDISAGTTWLMSALSAYLVTRSLQLLQNIFCT